MTENAMITFHWTVLYSVAYYLHVICADRVRSLSSACGEKNLFFALFTYTSRHLRVSQCGIVSIHNLRFKSNSCIRRHLSNICRSQRVVQRGNTLSLSQKHAVLIFSVCHSWCWCLELVKIAARPLRYELLEFSCTNMFGFAAFAVFLFVTHFNEEWYLRKRSVHEGIFPARLISLTSHVSAYFSFSVMQVLAFGVTAA